MLFSTSFLVALLPILAAAAPASGPIDKRAPLLETRNGQAIPGKYIIKLRNVASDTALNAALGRLSNKAERVYNFNKFKGFAGRLDDATLDVIRSIPEVEFVEEDAVFTTNAFVNQASAPWGLARISHRAPGNTTYTYDDSAGAGTCSYIIDTGIYTAHSDFGGRAIWAANFIDSSNTDGNGHGTHVAGTVGGTRYGVAKRTTLYAVKVLNAQGSGTTSSVISGMNYVATNYPSRSCPRGVVANMSLGGGFSSSINSAAANLVNAGVFLAVAAGNSNANASGFSPASEPSACTVGSTTNTDARSSFSNYGSLVDIWAPGSNILSAWIGSTTASNTISGTSMASPHVAGLGAYFLALQGPYTPAALCTYIRSVATSGRVTSLPSGNSNLLAFNNNPWG